MFSRYLFFPMYLGVLLSTSCARNVPGDAVAPTAPAITAAPALTGVSGRISVSPGCPGPQRAGQSCDRPLAQHAIELSNAAGATIASTITDDDGRYVMHASPGAVVLKVVQQGLYPRCAPTSLHIETARMAQVDIVCDSGMR